MSELAPALNPSEILIRDLRRLIAHARRQAVFTLLYTFIYVLLRVEAYALLVGATASFAAVAAAMYITRDIDWYGSATSLSSSSTSVPPARVAHESWLE